VREGNLEDKANQREPADFSLEGKKIREVQQTTAN
jgi:hypothetical protein